MKYWPNKRSRWLKIDLSPVVKTTLSMRTKNAEKRIFKKKEANILPFDQKSLLLHVLFGRGPNRVMETACFDVTSLNLKKVGMASRNIVMKKTIHVVMNQLYSYSSCAQLPPVWPTGISIFFCLGWQITREWGLLSCQVPRAGDEKRGQMPRHSFNTATFLTDRTVE